MDPYPRRMKNESISPTLLHTQQIERHTTKSLLPPLAVRNLRLFLPSRQRGTEADVVPTMGMTSTHG